MKNLNEETMLGIAGGLCLNDGIQPGLEIHFGDCFTVCNLLNLMNPEYSQACVF
jgi:hypothetical protein